MWFSVQCPNCKSKIKVNEPANYCTHCGYNLKDAPVPFPMKQIELFYCPNCNSIINYSEKNCPKCGFDLKGELDKQNLSRVCPLCNRFEFTRETTTKEKARKRKNFFCSACKNYF